MKKVIFCLLAALLPIAAFCADGDVFTVKTAEGRTMYMKVLSEQDKTCQVGDESHSNCLSWEDTGSSSKFSVTIPATANGYTVTAIGRMAFHGVYLMSSVSIPNTVKSIEDIAFDGTGLTSVTIPSGVTRIGSEAFAFCEHLTSVSIPASVTEMGYSVFQATALTNVPSMGGMTHLPSGIFSFCGGMKNITIPANITQILSGAFAYCVELSNIQFKGPVTILDDTAFKECFSLRHIDLPESLTAIGSKTFWNTPLESITLPSKLEFIGAEAFGLCKNLRSVEIPNSVTDMREYVFNQCTNLSHVKLSENVTHLWECVFQGCTKLKSVVIPDCVEEMEHRIFYESGLTEIRIPKNVRYLPNDVFERTPLERITVAEENPWFDSRNNCNAVITKTDVEYPRYAANTLIIGCKNTVIPSSVKIICYNAFSFCEGLTSMKIPEGVTTIQSCAFNECWNLKEVVFPSTITKIEDAAFQCGEYEPKLKSVTALMPEPCEIAENTFQKYDGVTLYVPANLIETYRKAPVWNQFKIQEATAISNIQTTTPQVTKRYMLDGRQASNQRGVVIERMSDGSTRKVIEKRP